MEAIGVNVGNNRRRQRPTIPPLAASAFIHREDEERGLCGTADEISWRHFETGSHSIDCAKAGALDSAFQVADERTIEPSLQVECHLREPKILSGSPHYFAKRPFHTGTRLNLLSTLGHLEEHADHLSAVGQRAVTDKPEESSLEAR